MEITREKSRETLRNKVSAGEYLAFLSVKYEVDPDKLFYALISAGENQESKCGDVSIECRGKTQEKGIFLIMKDSKVVAQFPISKAFFLERGNPIKNLMKTDMIRRHLVKRDKRPRSFLIKDLRTGMNRVNLKAKVLEILKPKLVFTRFGNYASVANAVIADETGSIRLCLWNEQIDSISVGDSIEIENGRMSMFRGEKQLRIGKNGTLRNIEALDPQMKQVHNA